MELLSNLNNLDMIPDGSTRKIPSIATTSQAGIVRPDGTTILINSEGRIAAAAGGGYEAGENIQIEDGVISATDTTYSAGSGITIVDGVIKSNHTVVTRTATFDQTTAEFISTDCTWQDVLDAWNAGSDMVIMGSMGGSTLWFFEEAVSFITGYKRALFRGNSVINGYVITLTITIPETGTASCLTVYNEKIAEKVTSWSQTTNNTNYPSEKLVKDSLDTKAAASDLTSEISTRSSQIQAVEERLDRLEGSLQYYLLELYEDTYIDPTTLQPVSGRTYEDDDFATDQLGDINLKAWLKYNYGLHDYEDLNTASVNITGFEIGYDKLWEYWTNLTNPLAPSYPDLQQTGQYRNEGTGAFSDFTNTVHGGIVGSQTDGYVESGGSGTGKVYGWSDLKNRVSAVEAVERFPSTATPLIDVQGGVVGTGTAYSREDHQHPTDTSREAAANKVSSWSATPNNSNYPTEKLVKDSIDVEATARSSADSALDSRVDTLETFKDTTVPNTYATITNLTAESSARSSADSALDSRVTTLETFKNTTVPNTYATISSLSAETSARSSADSTLQTNINNEASARSSADTALSNRITTLENTKVVVGDQTGYQVVISSSAPASGTGSNVITFVI